MSVLRGAGKPRRRGGQPYCGALIRDLDELLINIEDLPPEGLPKCGRCDALAHEDFLNRLATIYELKLRAAL